MSKEAKVEERDYDWLISRSRTAYSILSLEDLPREECTTSIIRKAYRKKALVLHPDKSKSPNAQEEFRELSVSYTILLDPILRQRYDNYLGKIDERRRLKGQVLGQRDRLKQDLLNNEEVYISGQNKKEMLQRKVAMLQREFDELKAAKLEESSQRENLNADDMTTHLVSKKVRVKWKNRPEIGDAFDEEILGKLMGVFGFIEDVRMSSLNKPRDNHHYATVTFKSAISSSMASVHDYSTSSSLWDEVEMGKLARLLRSVKLQPQLQLETDKYSQVQKLQLSFEDYVALSTIGIKRNL
ncbi:hypothetical protein FOA43_001336 [Brettanomyces nanus]|uniref:J domain-containing protein n=1 Tax=Eeniella nana TaxID=13502 RepID=A0A875S2G5_EENNA|nr:uncharacterized protein FOA43_001336 [Brettanomyces nanus]QPG74019.1 hypothetical protein FOA43_001336 [Brettanomyces nanus]